MMSLGKHFKLLYNYYSPRPVNDAMILPTEQY